MLTIIWDCFAVIGIAVTAVVAFFYAWACIIQADPRLYDGYDGPSILEKTDLQYLKRHG